MGSCRVAILHRSKLRPGRRQPPDAGCHRQAHPIHHHRKNPSLRRRSRDHQSHGQFRNRNRHRSRQRRHSQPGFRSQRGDSVGERERVTLLPSQQHHSHYRRQRGVNHRGPGPVLAADSGDSKSPKCPQLGVAGRQGEGVDGALHGRVDSVGSTVVWVVQPGAPRHTQTIAGVS